MDYTYAPKSYANDTMKKLSTKSNSNINGLTLRHIKISFLKNYRNKPAIDVTFRGLVQVNFFSTFELELFSINS